MDKGAIDANSEVKKPDLKEVATGNVEFEPLYTLPITLAGLSTLDNQPQKQ